LSDRTLALTSPHMTGDDVTGFQRDLNHRLDVWNVPLVLDVDGDYGMASRDAAASCCTAWVSTRAPRTASAPPTG
jgi:hypothetical protein